MFGILRISQPIMTDVPAGANDLLFEAQTPLGFSVRVTADRWKLIVTAKHPVMAGRIALGTNPTFANDPAKVAAPKRN